MAADGTQYLIELAAKFSGGDAAVTTLATLGDRMLKAGASAVELEKASEETASALESAAEAAKAASDALAAGETKYKSIETSADRAAKAVEKLALASEKEGEKLKAALAAGDPAKVSRLEGRIKALGDRQGEAAAKAAAAASAMKAEAVVLDAIKSKAEAAAQKHEALKKGLANVKAAATEAANLEKAAKGSGKVNEMAEALGKLGGPAGVAGQKLFGTAAGFSKLRVAMGTAGPYVAVAVAILAIATAAATAAFGVASWALSLADANRTQGMLIDGLAGSAKAGGDLAAAIDNVSSIVPMTRAELMDLAADLKKSGVAGDELADKLEAAAVKAATLKFGPDFAAQMKSLPFQAKRFEEHIAATFGGLDIDPFLDGLQSLVALFDSSTASGKALKFLFESLFQPIINAVVEAMPKIERMFLQAEILALKAFIALKPYSEEIKALGVLLAVGVGVVIAAVALAFGALVVAIAAATAALGAIAVAVGAVLYGLVELGKAIYQFFATLDLRTMGANLIQGLVDGITSGATAVVNAMTNVVSGAVDAAKSALGIASRSKVLYGIGGYTAEGFTEGVEGGAGDAQGALEAMVAPPSAGGGVGAGGARAGVITVTIGTIVVGGENTKEQATDLIDQFVAWLESAGISVGGGEVPSNA